MSAGRILKTLALTVGVGLLLLVFGVAWRLWDNGQVRVHSAEQAVVMAKAAAGRPVADLPVRVETTQDFWTVRFGPDAKGQVHSYLVTIWDKRASLLVAEITDEVDLDLSK